MKYIIMFLFGLLIALSVYTIWQKMNAKRIQADIDKAEELSPVIKNNENNLIITLDKIEQQKENIQILKDSMNSIGIDSLPLDEAIQIIKRRAQQYEKDSNINIIISDPIIY